MLPLQARVDLGVMAMKGYSAFPKLLELLVSYQVSYRCIFQPPSQPLGLAYYDIKHFLSVSIITYPCNSFAYYQFLFHYICRYKYSFLSIFVLSRSSRVQSPQICHLKYLYSCIWFFGLFVFCCFFFHSCFLIVLCGTAHPMSV